MNKGFIRVAAAVPQVKVADVQYNADQIVSQVKDAAQKSIALVSFPELTLTSVSCGDLYRNTLLLDKTIAALDYVLQKTQKTPVLFVIGLPVAYNNILLSVAAVCYQGEIIGLVPKASLTAKAPFQGVERGVKLEFQLGSHTTILAEQLLFRTSDFSFAVCFDNYASTTNLDVDFICCLSDKPSYASIDTNQLSYLKGFTYAYNKACIYATPGFGESTTDKVFGGNAVIIDQGSVLAVNEKYQMKGSLIYSEIDIAQIRAMTQDKRRGNTESVAEVFISFKQEEIKQMVRSINPHPFLADESSKSRVYKEAYAIQSMGLIQRLKHIHGQKVVLGISGGLDSTLALLVCMNALDKMNLPRKNIIGITMPGFGTTGRTYQNAQMLMSKMGISVREINIKKACIQHFEDIGHDMRIHDITYENSQARERTQLLMDIANQENALVVGTGDLSELALGWATYNGDHMSMYAVNASIPKTLVQELVKWVAVNEADIELRETLLDIVDTPISPELTPASNEGEIQQKTEDLVGPYELHDFYLYYTLKYGFSPRLIYERANTAFEGQYSRAIIKKWLYTFFKRFFMQQFKRSCLPDGPDVTGVSLSPRGGWSMASDVSPNLWLNEIEELR